MCPVCAVNGRTYLGGCRVQGTGHKVQYTRKSLPMLRPATFQVQDGKQVG